jgi:hypothetical protein
MKTGRANSPHLRREAEKFTRKYMGHQQTGSLFVVVPPSDPSLDPPLISLQREVRRLECRREMHFA